VRQIYKGDYDMLISITRTYWEDLDFKARICLGVSAKHLCRVAKISKSTRSGLESGSNPQLKTRKRITQAWELLALS